MNIINKIENLPPEKKELLLRKLPPTSESQNRILELGKIKDLNNTTCIPILINGRFDVALFKKSIELIQKRHEILRTTFLTINKISRQIIQQHDPEGISKYIKVIDKSNVKNEDKKLVTGKIFVQETKREFNPEKLPLWRITVVRFSESEHTIILNFHQTIFDGLSLPILLKEIYTFYSQLNNKNEQKTIRPELKLQYKDFARWERDLLQSEYSDKQKLFWREYLKNPPKNPKLVGEEKNHERTLYKAKVIAYELEEKQTAKVKESCNNLNLTIYMYAVAALARTLYCYSDEKEVIISSPMSGRSLNGTNELIGCFVNIIPIRIKQTQKNNKEFLKSVKENILTTHQHQNFPFSLILDSIYPDSKKSNYGRLGKEPLFNIAIDYKSTEKDNQGSDNLDDLEVSIIDTEEKFTGSDLFIKIWEEDDHIEGNILYNSELMDIVNINKFVKKFTQNLSDLAEIKNR